MIFRILTGAHRDWWDATQQTYVRPPLPMLGAGRILSRMMWELHFPAPEIANARARFWFTELGWDRFGRALAAEGRRQGFVVNVIRGKNSRRSRIVYADEWQMAILPTRGNR